MNEQVKNDILYKLNVLIGTLSNISVRGEQDCAGVAGSIQILRELCGTISKCEFDKKDEKSALAKRMAKEE